MSEVLDYIRSKDERFKEVPDDELTAYVGSKFPEFRKDKDFNDLFESRVEAPAQAKQMESLGPRVSVPPEMAGSEVGRMLANRREDILDRQAAGTAYQPDVSEAAMLSADAIAPSPKLPDLGESLLLGTKRMGAAFFTPTVPFQKLNITPEQVSDALSPDERSSVPGGLAKATAGTQQAINATLESLTTPFAIATFGTGTLLKGAGARILSGLFAADMARHTPEQIRAFRQALDSGDTEAIAKTGVGLGLSATFLYGAAKHAAEPNSPAKQAGEALLKAMDDPARLDRLEEAAKDLALKVSLPPRPASVAEVYEAAAPKTTEALKEADIEGVGLKVGTIITEQPAPEPGSAPLTKAAAEEVKSNAIRVESPSGEVLRPPVTGEGKGVELPGVGEVNAPPKEPASAQEAASSSVPQGELTKPKPAEEVITSGLQDQEKGQEKGNDVLTQPAATASTVAAEPVLAKPSEFTPALRTKDGKVIIGEQGKLHNDIYKAQPGVEGSILRLEQPEHGFVRDGKFYSRDEVSKMLDEIEPMQSERLKELQDAERKAGQKPTLFKEGDKVAFEGNMGIIRGEVVKAPSGELKVKSGEDMYPLHDQWKPDAEVVKPEVSGAAPYKQSSLYALVENPNHIRKEWLDRGLELINALRNKMAERGISPDTATSNKEIETSLIQSITGSLTRIGRQQRMIDKGWKRGNEETRDAAIKQLEEAFSEADNILKPAAPELPISEPAAPAPESGGINTGALGEVGMGGAKPGEFVPSGGKATGIKNATVDAERQSRGLPPMMAPERLANAVVWDRVMARIDREPGWQDQLINELRDHPRPIDQDEVLALDHRYADLQNEYAKATRDGARAHEDGNQTGVDQARIGMAFYEDKLNELERIAKQTGTEQGRAFQMRQRLLNEDFSLAGMESRMRAAKGFEPLTDAEHNEIADLQAKIAEKDAASAAAEQRYNEKIAAIEAEKAVAEAKAAAAKAPEYEPRVLAAAEKFAKFMDRKGDEALARLRDRMGRTSTIDPTILADYGILGAAKITRGIVDKLKWIDSMVRDLGERFRQDADEAWKEAQRVFQSDLDSFHKGVDKGTREKIKKTAAGISGEINYNQEVIKAKLEQEGIPIHSDVRKLVKLLVEQNPKITRDELVDAVHGVLKEVKPETTRLEAMDAISGRGRFWTPPQDVVSKTVRDLATQIRLVGHQIDVEAGRPLPRTGYQPEKMTDAARQEQQKLNELKRKYGVVVTDPATQLGSVLSARKTYYRNRIADLKQEIATKERIVKAKTPSPTDPELEAIKAEYENLKKDHDEIFGRRELTDEQRLKLAIAAAERNEASWNERLAEAKKGNFAAKKPARKITSVELEAIKARSEAVKAEVQELKKADSLVQEQKKIKALEKSIADYEEKIKSGETVKEPDKLGPESQKVTELTAKRDELASQLKEIRKLSPAGREVALRSLKTRMANTKADLQDRIARGDFSKKTRAKLVPDRELLQAQTEVAALRKQFKKMVVQQELKNRSKLKKATDIFLRVRREFVLSGISSIGKLASYSLQEFAIAPFREAVGAVISKVPFIKQVAERAPSETIHGGAAREIAAMAGDYADAFTKGIKDAKDIWSRGESELKTIHDPAVRDEAEFRSFFGTLHQMEKSPLIRFNFERSFRRRMEYNALNGVDITDFMVQTKLAAEAYQDALRGALINRNAVVAKVQRFVNSFSEKSKVTGRTPILGEIARFVFYAENPVMHVPANYVARTAEHIFGSVSGSVKTGLAFRRGIESLQPQEADQIMRHLKSGSIGVAAMLTGFFAYKSFGGFWTPNRDDKKEPKSGEIKVGDVNVRRWATHNQLLNAAQFGATLRQVSESKLRKDFRERAGLSAGAQAALFGLVDETPYAREISDFARAKDPRQSSKLINEKIKGYVIPQGVSQAAELTDLDQNLRTVKREPKTLTDTLKAGVPGFREEVPVKKRSSR